MATIGVFNLCHKHSVSDNKSCLVSVLVEPISNILTSIRAGKVTHSYERVVKCGTSVITTRFSHIANVYMTNEISLVISR